MKFLVIFLFICFALQLQAQQSPTFGISYWGEMGFHPGLKLSADFQPLGNVKFKDRKRKEGYRIRTHSLFTAPHLGYFVHPGNHQGLALGGDIGYRLFVAKNKEKSVKTSGFVFEVFVNTDLFLQINSGATYTIDDNDEVFPVSGLRAYFLAGTGLGFGYRLAKPEMTILLRPNLSWQMPYDAIVLPRGFIELGVNFALATKKYK